MCSFNNVLVSSGFIIHQKRKVSHTDVAIKPEVELLPYFNDAKKMWLSYIPINIPCKINASRFIGDIFKVVNNKNGNVIKEIPNPRIIPNMYPLVFTVWLYFK